MPKIPLVVFYLLPFPVLILSLFVGPAGSVDPANLLRWLVGLIGGGTISGDQLSLQLVRDIVVNVRLPRLCLAFLVGGALTVSGTSLQAMVRNPLVSPDILGLSAGAAFGAALALSTSWLPLQPTAFVFGLLAAVLSYVLAVDRHRLSLVSLVLAGIIIGSIFTALLTIVQICNDPFKLQSIVHWTMGNLHNASWTKVASAIGPVMVGTAVLFFCRWRMNVLALGDDETRAVGLNPEREKLLILIPATLIASASVAVAGIISMVGLAVPHMVRMLVGPDNTKTIPVSFLFGGSFLVLVDDFSRSITFFELPVGLFTTLIGGPFFIYLLKRRESGFKE
jgi:iron complex transport system permease protein